MRVKVLVPVLTMLLTACTVTPISERPIPEGDLVRCRALADTAEEGPTLLSRTMLSAAKGFAIDAAIKTAVVSSAGQIFRIPFTTITTLSATSLLPLFAAIGLIEGFVDADADRSRIVRECLRDAGLMVY